MPFRIESLMTLRERENLSQRELAKRLDVSNAAISRWEANLRTPTIENIDCLYDFAHKRGYQDLVFYEPPKR